MPHKILLLALAAIGILNALDRDATWYSSIEARHIADVIVLLVLLRTPTGARRLHRLV